MKNRILTHLLFIALTFIDFGCASRSVEVQENNLPQADGVVKPNTVPPHYTPDAEILDKKIEDESERTVKRGES